MTDIEMVKLCADALGVYDNMDDFRLPDGEIFAKIADYPVREYGSMLGRQDPMSAGGVVDTFDPLHDDTQAMALIKHFRLTIGYNQGWSAALDGCQTFHYPDLNRAIVECIAQMQKHNPKLLANKMRSTST